MVDVHLEVNVKDNTVELVNSLAKNGVIVLVGRSAGRALLFFVQITLGRFLGPIGFGIYALGVATIDIVSTVSSLGFDKGILRFTAIFRGNKSEEPQLLGSIQLSFVTGLCVGVLGGILTYILSPWISHVLSEPQLEDVLRAFSFSIPFYALFLVVSGLIRGSNKMALDMLIRELLKPTTNLVLLFLVFYFFKQYLLGAVLAFDITLILSVMLGLLSIYYLYPGSFKKFYFSKIWRNREIWSYSLSMLAIAIGAFGLFRVDKLILGNFVSSGQVGIYSATVMFATQNTFLLGAVNTAFAPQIAKLYHQYEMKKLEYLLKLLNRWSTMAILPFIMVSILFPKEILGLMGEGFRGGWLSLTILSIGQFINAITGSVGTLLSMSGNQKPEIWNTFITFLVGVLLIYWLSPRYGILGGSIGIAVALSFVNVMRVGQVYIIMRIHPFSKELLKVINIATVVTIIWIVIDQVTDWKGLLQLFVGGLIVIAMYAFALWHWGLQENDKIMLSAAKNRLKLSMRWS